MDEQMFHAQVMAEREQEDAMQSKLFAAMAKAFPLIESATKDKVNPHFKSKYADLASVVDAIKPALIKNGLFFAQITHDTDGGVCVETIVCHESGESMSFGKLSVPASKNDAQGFGSALTYARRYSLMSAFGVPAEDDDGNAAVKAKNDDGNAAAKSAPKNDTTPAVAPDRATVIRRVADACIAAVAAGNDYGAYEEASHIDETDEKLLLWQYLASHSKVRSAIKAQADLEKHGLSRALAQ